MGDTLRDSRSGTDPLRTLVRAEGVRLYRDLPWRRTRDPYGIWLSEVMLQQTQVPRVMTRWEAWLDRFPSVFALAEASTADVLVAWQGMGYNRRALALKAAAEQVVRDFDGEFPRDAVALRSLPGIGPATAQGIRAFAFDLPGVYLETNVRTVFLHHCFPDVPAVPDRELAPLVEATCPAAPGSATGAPESATAARGAGADAAAGEVAGGAEVAGAADAPGAGELTGAGCPAGPFAVPQDADDTPRSWYYALLDYGAFLKRTVPNPSRRSKAYTRQSRFEGSRRQKRAEIVRLLLDAPVDGLGLGEIVAGLNGAEAAAGREPVEASLAASILDDLAHEGFCRERDGRWAIA